MNADLTFNSIVFEKQYDSKEESARSSIARGINTPDKLFIRSQSYVDSVTKVPGQRFLISVERVDIDPNNALISQRAQVTIAVPVTSVQASIDVLIATLKAAVANADLIADVIAGQK